MMKYNNISNHVNNTIKIDLLMILMIDDYMDVCYDFELYDSSHPKDLILGDPSQNVTTRLSFRNICKHL